MLVLIKKDLLQQMDVRILITMVFMMELTNVQPLLVAPHIADALIPMVMEYMMI